jgi:hypothetical protein
LRTGFCVPILELCHQLSNIWLTHWREGEKWIILLILIFIFIFIVRDEFGQWWATLSKSEQDNALAVVKLLE